MENSIGQKRDILTKLKITKEMFRISEPFHDYARYREMLASVKAQIETLTGILTRQELHNLLPAGAAQNAVDCVLWDVEAKATGKRVWELVGLASPIPLITTFTISLNTPEKMRTQVQRNCSRPLLKTKRETPNDMPRLEAVCQGAPLSDIIVDANEGWDAETYAELARDLLRLGVKLVEQPFPAENDEARLEMERPVPICADESCHDRTSLSKLTRKYDMVNINPKKAGGLSEAILLRDEARRLVYEIMVGCMVGSSPAMALATLISQGAMISDLDGPLLLAEDRDIPLIYDEQDGHPPEAALWG